MPTDDGNQWDLIRMQVSQSLVEHEIVAQALRAQAIVSAIFILVLGSLCFLIWRRHACLNEAFLDEIKRHSAERCGMVKQHSLELVSLQMQMLHAFEGMVSQRPLASASSPHSFEGSRRPPPKPVP
jgi:hypothetical protein